MNRPSWRFPLAIGSLAFAILSILTGNYVSVLTGDLFGVDDLTLKALFLASFILSGYFAACAVYNRVLLVHLFRNEGVIAMLGSLAALTSVISVFFLLNCRDFEWRFFTAFVTSTFLSAACFRFGFDYRAFGFLAILFGLPAGLLSVGPVLYFLNPPPVGPVGGHGINTGIVISLMEPFTLMAVLLWLASLAFEKWPIAWHATITILCVPGMFVLAGVFLGIAG